AIEAALLPWTEGFMQHLSGVERNGDVICARVEPLGGDPFPVTIQANDAGLVVVRHTARFRCSRAEALHLANVVNRDGSLISGDGDVNFDLEKIVRAVVGDD